ncbi:MAG: chemotaxis protein CheD [Desulfatiglans sp.]|nr:chemotaxis protein CheD [Thermodesulfobacteriota bacterium]MEE4351434.1 chemotaxis protein CheD [Desulfatiglans sp.]
MGENTTNMVVGVSDMKVSNDPRSTLMTYSLGSCIGIAIYDQVARVGGLLHYMLPDSTIDQDKAKKNPFMFADTGIPLLFKAAYTLGGKKQRMKVIVVGGAQVLDQKGFFNIGKRNHMALRKIFWKNKVMIDFEEVGGTSNRTLKLAIEDGHTWLKTSGVGEREI